MTLLRNNFPATIALALLVTAVHGQVAKKANENYQTEEGRARIAHSLGSGDRDQKQRPVELVRALGLKPGMTVADVGTGVGYMLPYLSQAVGVKGQVIAEDIFDDFLAKARAASEKAGLRNVTFIKGDVHGAQLPPRKVDLILALDSYHHYDYPRDMLAGFRSALKRGGRLAIVEYYKRENAMGNGNNALTHIRLDDSGVVKEVEAAGFQLVEEKEHIPHSQYIAIFRVAGKAK